MRGSVSLPYVLRQNRGLKYQDDIFSQPPSVSGEAGFCVFRGKKNSTFFATEHTETPFGRHGRRLGKECASRDSAALLYRSGHTDRSDHTIQT